MDLEDIKKAQLKEAMALDEMGVDPDKIMVTYSPEEYALMHPEGFINYETPDYENMLLQDTIIGDFTATASVEISKEAFSRGFQVPGIETYLDTVEKEVLLLDGYKHEDLLLRSQNHILDEFLVAIGAILESLKDELAEYDDLVNNAVSYHTKIELEEDRRTTSRITSRVDSVYRKIISLQRKINEILELGMGSR